MSASSVAFDRICQELESVTSLTRLEARGTVRLALKEAGLEARTVTAAQMKIVIQKILPAELGSRGIESAPACERLLRALGALVENPASAASPVDIFRHLGGD